jgi:hypothetical protein
MPATTGSPTPMGAVGPSGRAGAGSASALSEMDSSGLGAALSEVDGSGGGSGSVESPRVVQAAAQYHVWSDSASASSVSDVDDDAHRLQVMEEPRRVQEEDGEDNSDGDGGKEQAQLLLQSLQRQHGPERELRQHDVARQQQHQQQQVAAVRQQQQLAAMQQQELAAIREDIKKLTTAVSLALASPLPAAAAAAAAAGQGAVGRDGVVRGSQTTIPVLSWDGSSEEPDRVAAASMGHGVGDDVEEDDHDDAAAAAADVPGLRRDIARVAAAAQRVRDVCHGATAAGVGPPEGRPPLLRG